MSSMTSYYGRMKSGIGNINSADMAQLGEDWLVTAAAGAGIGLISAALGGLDKKVFGVTVPVDGLASIALGIVGLQARGETGKMLKIASIAAGGSAAVRTFEGFFKTGLKVKGDFEDLNASPYGALPQFGPGVGFGVGATDRLVEAAKYL